MAETNFSLDQGSDFKRLITIKDGAGVPVNLTGRTFAGAAKKDYRAVSASFVLSLNVLDQALFPGQIELTVSAESTRELKIFEASPYLYDIKQIIAGDESILLYGKIFVLPRVTK